MNALHTVKLFGSRRLTVLFRAVSCCDVARGRESQLRVRRLYWPCPSTTLTPCLPSTIHTGRTTATTICREPLMSLWTTAIQSQLVSPKAKSILFMPHRLKTTTATRAYPTTLRMTTILERLALIVSPMTASNQKSRIRHLTHGAVDESRGARQWASTVRNMLSEVCFYRLFAC